MTINIDVGFGPGGGYDALCSRVGPTSGQIPPRQSDCHRPQHAGRRFATGCQLHLFRGAEGRQRARRNRRISRDGRPLGNDQAKFEASKFGWVGSMDQDVSFCGVWDRPENPKTFQEMLTRETTFGATGAGATSHTHPLILKNLLGAKIKLISGFSGTKETNLAMQRGEVAASCSLFVSTIMTTLMDDVNSGRLKLFIQMGPQRSDQFGQVPSVYDFAKTDEDRKVLALHFDQILLARPIIAPAGMAPERLKVLRAGFDAAMKDPELVEDAKRQHLVINPVNGADVEKLLVQFANYPPNIIARPRGDRAIAATSTMKVALLRADLFDTEGMT